MHENYILPSKDIDMGNITYVTCKAISVGVLQNHTQKRTVDQNNICNYDIIAQLNKNSPTMRKSK